MRSIRSAGIREDGPASHLFLNLSLLSENARTLRHMPEREQETEPMRIRDEGLAAPVPVNVKDLHGNKEETGTCAPDRPHGSDRGAGVQDLQTAADNWPVL